MARNANKTVETEVDVEDFLKGVDDPQKLEDSRTLIEMMSEMTGEPAKMWGPSIIGFGKYHYKYESGREGDMPLAAFSPRKAAISVYLTPADRLETIGPLLEKLGKHKMAKGCLYIKRLSDVDLNVLRQLVQESADSV